MDQDLLLPAATVVAGLMAQSGSDAGIPLLDIKATFIHVYRELEAAKKELMAGTDSG